MTKILYVSPQDFSDIFSQQLDQRSSALIVMGQDGSDNDMERVIYELLTQKYKCVKVSYGANPRKQFYQEIAEKLDMTVTDKSGRILTIKELKQAIGNNIHESDILFLPGGAKLLNLSATGDWLSGLIQKEAIIITYRSLNLEEGPRLSLIGIRLKDRPVIDVNLPLYQNLDGKINSQKISTLQPLKEINSRLGSSFMPRFTAGWIDKSYPEHNRRRNMLLGAFTIGLIISLSPLLGLAVNAMILYTIAGLALIGFAIVK